MRSAAVTAYGRALVTDRLQAANAGAILRARLALEKDDGVRAALCVVLGRLNYQTPADVQSAESALTGATRSGGTSDASPVTILGAARGLESLIRLRVKISFPAAETVERLRGLSSSAKEALMRRLALATLIASGKLDGPFLARAIQDADEQVRRLAVRGTAALQSGDAHADTILARGLRDSAAMVRYDALGAYSRRGCASNNAETDTLARIADGLPPSAADSGWHAPAHALVALAKIAPEMARLRLARFAAHPQWQVRAYGARAAVTVGDIAVLEELARDSSDNVRTAALGGLITTRRHDADPLYLEALAARDYQLISTAARGLAGTPDKPGAVSALLSSLARLTLERRDTSRDPRVAILQRLRELGSRESAAAIQPYLEDFDPRVASLTAEVLTAWTGKQHQALTKVWDPGPPPQLKEIEDLGSATARVTLHTGSSFELRLLSDEAPATVLRFVHLARTGYYNGLTFHRVEPNFVIQGGSPGANEYMGDARYMRDELGRLMHARGTVGISTRGRDTGDAQIFINLVDNPRLDPDYTVFADIVRGLEVIDGVLEGDIIDHVEIRTGRSGTIGK